MYLAFVRPQFLVAHFPPTIAQIWFRKPPSTTRSPFCSSRALLRCSSSGRAGCPGRPLHILCVAIAALPAKMFAFQQLSHATMTSFSGEDLKGAASTTSGHSSEDSSTLDELLGPSVVYTGSYEDLGI